MDKFKKIIRKFIQTKKYLKLFLGRRLLKKFSKNNHLIEDQFLIQLLIDKKPDEAAVYLLKNFDLDNFKSYEIPAKDKKLITYYLKNLKSRYFEFFLFIFNIESQVLYGELNEDITILRKNLTFSDQKSFFRDQIKEFKTIFNKDIPLMEKEELMKTFEEKKNEDEKLFTHIDEMSSFYLARKFLYPDMKSIYRILKVRKYLKSKFSKEKTFSILDYGCGAAFPSLFCSTQGDKSTICDIGGVLNAAKERLKNRGINVNPHEATPSDPVSNCGNDFDVIICDEVIEHVRYPLDLLKMLKSSLAPNGVLILGSFPFTPTVAIGDHLKESVDNQKDLKEWIYKNFKPLIINDCDNTFEHI